MNSLMLKLEPTYLLTEDNGKTPRTSRWVGPVLSHWLNQERNGQILRTLRLVIGARQCKGVEGETGQTPIRVDLTPISGSLGFGIASDQLSFDRLMEAELQDDLAVPQLNSLERKVQLRTRRRANSPKKTRENEETLEN